MQHGPLFTRRVILSICLAVPACAWAGGIEYSGIGSIGAGTVDAARADRFYREVLGFDPAPRGGASGRYYKVNDTQFIELVAGPIDSANRRVKYFSLMTRDVRTACELVRRGGLETTGVARGDDGSLRCSLQDPDGNRIVLAQAVAGSLQERTRGKLLGARRISTRLRHAGVQVADLDAAVTFYREKLGLAAEVLQHGNTRWANMHLQPDKAGDYIQLRIGPQQMRPEFMWPHEHFGFDVEDAHATHRLLIQRGAPPADGLTPVVGYAGHLKINFADPDKTLIELMELGAAKAEERREQ